MITPIPLGSTVEDEITGVTGLVVARTKWLYGCIRITIQPAELKDGRPVDTVCLDEQQVKRLEVPLIGPVTEEKPVNTPRPAGPRADPTRQDDPKK